MKMRRLAIFLGLTIFVAPCVQARERDSTIQTRRLQNEWHRCLNESFKFSLLKLGERNIAAESAFSACKIEEDQLTEYFVASTGTALGLSSLKSAMKDVLINKGKLKIYLIDK